MPTYHSLSTLLEDALKESLEIAAYCIRTPKNGIFNTSDDRYGFPGSILLLCIVDAIGAHCTQDKVIVNGKKVKIGKSHFRIMNSDYFGESNLTSQEIDLIEKSYRNLLVHQHTIRPNYWIGIGNDGDRILEPFSEGYRLNLTPLLNACKGAYGLFMSRNPYIRPPHSITHS